MNGWSLLWGCLIDHACSVHAVSTLKWIPSQDVERQACGNIVGAESDDDNSNHMNAPASNHKLHTNMKTSDRPIQPSSLNDSATPYVLPPQKCRQLTVMTILHSKLRLKKTKLPHLTGLHVLCHDMPSFSHALKGPGAG